MKKLRLLKLIRYIKSLNKNDFHVFIVDKDTDMKTIDYLSEILNKKNIKHVVICDICEVKSFSASEKEELLNYVKKEIGMEG